MKYVNPTYSIPIELDSNSKEFLRDRKFPPNSSYLVEVSWVEEWVNTEDDLILEFVFTRSFERHRAAKWVYATSFAFKLAGGFLSSQDKSKAWDLTTYENSRDGEIFSRVTRVTLSVDF